MTRQRIVGDVRRALGYLAQAARLVKRHPSLLLLPVAVVAFNVAEAHVGQQLMVQRTEYGRWLREHARELPRQPPPDSRQWVLRVEIPGGTGVPHLPLTGTSALLGAAVGGYPRASVSSSPPTDYRLVAVAVALSLLLLLPVNALVRGGYYGLVARALSTGKAEAAWFARSAGRFFVRFWLLLAVLAILYLAVFLVPFPVLVRYDLGLVLVRLQIWLMVAAIFVLTVISAALVWEDSSLWTAVRRSFTTVGRDVAVAVPLFAVAVAAENVSAWLFGWVRVWTWQQPKAPGSVPLSNMFTDAGQRCMLALVGAWLAVAVMLWCRDASARLWPRAEGNRLPTSAEA